MNAPQTLSHSTPPRFQPGRNGVCGPVQILLRELRQGCPRGRGRPNGTASTLSRRLSPVPSTGGQGPWSPQAAAPVCAPSPSRRAHAARTPPAAPPRRQGCAEAPPAQAQGSGPPLGGASGVLWSTSETRPATGGPAGMRMDPDNESRPQALSPWAMTSSRFFPFSSLMTYNDHNRPLPETPFHAACLHGAFSGRGGAGRRGAPGEDAPKPAGPPVRRGGSPRTWLLRRRAARGSRARPRLPATGQRSSWTSPPSRRESVRPAP